VSLACYIKLHTLLTLLWDSLMPSMITRLILSLKKAAISPNSLWSSTGVGQLGTVIFSQRTVGRTERFRGGGVVPRNLSSVGTSGRSWGNDQNI